MVLWVDKYRPSTFDKLEIHKELSTQLKNIVQTGDFPHLLFYGPSGAGKKTRILALLRQIYGSKVEKNKEVAVGANESKTVTITTLSSPYHIELTPCDAGVYDRYVITNVIKEIAQSAPIDQSAEKKFKVVVLNEIDNLTREAQQALRRTMEKYMKTCRIILSATSTSKVLAPIKSRCLNLRVPAPSNADILSLLQKIAQKENFILPKAFADKIVEASESNLRRAILMLEASKIQQCPFKDDQTVKIPDWEMFIADICREVMEEQSPKRLLEVRDKFYLLLTNCIPAELIIKKLATLLIEKVQLDLQHDILYWAAHYEHRLKTGSRAIFHIEAFVAKFMSIYKRFVMEISDME